MRNRIATLVIDPHPVFRRGIKCIFSRTKFHCCHAAASIAEVPDDVIASRAALCVVGTAEDWTVPISAIRHIRSLSDKLPIAVICSTYNEDDVLKAIELGANGFLTKEVGCEALVNFLELIAAGENIVPIGYFESLAARKAPSINIAHQRSFSDTDIARIENLNGAGIGLSSREELILRHLIEGASNKGIARRLDITEATVKVHVKAVLRKIRVKNRTQAAIWAMHNFGDKLEVNGNGMHRSQDDATSEPASLTAP